LTRTGHTLALFDPPPFAAIRSFLGG
jgi:hypothetical protein